MSRTELVEETGLTPSAVSRITREMISAGILMEGESRAAKGRAGRREVQLSINPQGAYVLAISLTANRKGIAIADAHGETISIDRFDDLDVANPERALDWIADRAKSLVYDADFNRSRLLGIGVSAALSAGSTEEHATSDPLGWKDVPLRSVLSEKLGLPVRVEPRASALLRAEIAGRPDPDDLYLVNVALSVGTSAFLDGRVVTSGSSGFGSIAHFRVQGDENRCPCGRTGCVDVCASGRAVLRYLGLGDAPPPTLAKRVFEAVENAIRGDEAARVAFRTAGQNMSQGLDAVLNLFNPATIILAGEVGRQPDFKMGVLEGLRMLGRTDAESRINCSELTSMQAATHVALQEFVFTESLDLAQLRAA